MTKQEKIKEEYKKQKDLKWYENNFEFINFDNGYFQNRDEYFRIDSLQGIENNNGWIKIESKSDLPKTDIDCWFIHQGELIKGNFERQWFNCNFGVFGSLTISHYLPIVKPILPLY